MKRYGLLLLTCGFLGAWSAAARGDDAKPAQDVSQYLDQLQVKLEHAAQRANQPSADGSSVVGLRGSQQEPISKQLYWKGKKGRVPVSTEEIKVFRAAVEQARAGHKDEAIAALKAFEDKYPKSALRPDAEETTRLLSQTVPSAPPDTTSQPKS